MPMEPGQMLSHYRLIEKIGEGGMGVVWKARDEKLRRDVALKVLPADLVEDLERRRRLLREARSAAAINHPNIGTVYEVDEAEGTVFIAMELVEGKTLRSLLRGKPLAIPEALRIGRGRWSSRPRRVCPRTYSMATKTTPSASPTSKTLAMFG